MKRIVFIYYIVILMNLFLVNCNRVESPTETTSVTAPSMTITSGDVTMNIGDGLITAEDGTTDTFTIVLESQPADTVTVSTITSSDTGEVSVSPSTLTFTTANWGTAQTVTLTGIDDTIADGYQLATIDLGTTTSTDSGFNGISLGTLIVSNLDDDSPATYEVVIASNGLVVGEASLTDSVQVSLSSAPVADVTIATISSSDVGEATVSPATLTFTSSNWNVAQTVTVSGVDDAVADGTQSVTIDLGTTTSSDANWNGISPANLTAYNLDDDGAVSPGITVIAAPSYLTGEGGTTATFNVVLNTQPTATVTIGLSTSDSTEGAITTPATSSITFTTTNWDTVQSVVVQGQDDSTVDGDVPYAVQFAAAVSTDTDYSGLTPSDVSFTNVDDDAAGIVISAGNGLITSEDGTTDTFEVVLASEPSATVTIATIASSDTGEVTVSPATLDFTTTNWDTAQTVTVTGVDDATADGYQSVTIDMDTAASTDGNYNGITPADQTVFNIDNDSAAVPGITVIAAPSYLTSESGTTATFNVVLNTQPTASVTIDLSTSDSTEGAITTPATSSLTFTTSNWDSVQSVVVQGQDDDTIDGDVAYTIQFAAAVSTDGDYSGLTPSNVSFTNVDDDTAGIVISGVGGGLVTNEAGTTDTFEVVLASEPSGTVTISAITSGDTGEVTVSPATLDFYVTTWNIPQTITVTGVDDAVVDGYQTVTIDMGTATSTDTNYNGLAPADQTVYNVDNDSLPSVVILDNPDGYVTNENGYSTQIILALSRQPTADVTLGTISSGDNGEGDVDVSSLTFTSSDWSNPHVINITPVDDATVDGNVAYDIDLGTTSSSDTDFNGLDPGDITITNMDSVTVTDYAYSYNAVSTTFTSISGTGTAISLLALSGGLSSEDEGYAVISNFFEFWYMGKKYDSLVVYTNGFASFNKENIYSVYNYGSEHLVSSNYGVINVLAPWWGDMLVDAGGMYYQVDGTSPDRTLTIEWNNIYAYGAYLDEFYTYQLILYENGNVIEFVYGPCSDGHTGTDEVDATYGIKWDPGMSATFFINGYNGSTASGTLHHYSSFPTVWDGGEGTVVRFEAPW